MIDVSRLDARNPVERSFLEFHAANPHVYKALVDLSHRTKRAGHPQFGIDMIQTVARWNSMVGITIGDEFLLNNNHRPYYARLLMLGEDDLWGVFETRAIRVPSALDDLYERRLRETD